jgi:hypothetical protein
LDPDLEDISQNNKFCLELFLVSRGATAEAKAMATAATALVTMADEGYGNGSGDVGGLSNGDGCCNGWDEGNGIGKCGGGGQR